MLTFTDEAKKRLQEGLKDKDLNIYGIRLPSNDGAFFDLEWVHLGEVTVNESFAEVGGVMFIFERSVKGAIEKARIDYVPGGLLPGKFQIEFPEVTTQGVFGPDYSDPVVQKIQNVLNNEINPAIASHGGVARIYDYKDRILYLQFGGGCHGCGMVDATLKQGIEVRLKEEIPELVAVLDQTDHSTGTNPYIPRE
jgi:Fe/S biogenesis protein NfuA